MSDGSGIDPTDSRQQRDRPALCRTCQQRTTWQLSAICLCCVPFEVPNRTKASAA